MEYDQIEAHLCYLTLASLVFTNEIIIYKSTKPPLR